VARQAPAHDRIVADVEGKINRGELRPGDAVESEAALAARFSVSRGTVRAALLSLERSGLIETVPAKGRYVRDSSRGESASPSDNARRVSAELRAEIDAGGLAPGAPFHSEKAVAERFGVSRYTARAALSELEAGGLIVARHGRGRFVADQPPHKTKGSAHD
jgi:DNA-binding GntR family transcriptional regulator